MFIMFIMFIMYIVYINIYTTLFYNDELCILNDEFCSAAKGRYRASLSEAVKATVIRSLASTLLKSRIERGFVAVVVCFHRHQASSREI